MRGGPVGVAVEKGSDNAAVEYAGKRLMMRLSVKLRDILIALGKAPNVQPLLIRRPTSEADTLG